MKDRLSLCMIVKNEADALGDCLKSVQDLVGEIAILDTGSTDETVAIAKEFGATVGHFDWNQDFAAARNEALKLVTKEWVLVLDADETLNPKVIRPSKRRSPSRILWWSICSAMKLARVNPPTPWCLGYFAVTRL